jgi:hypothetical protein
VDVEIPLNTLYLPKIDTMVYCHNLKIDSGTTLSIDSTAQIKLKGNFLNKGRLNMLKPFNLTVSGTTPQTIPGGLTVNNFVMNNANGLTVNGSVSVSGLLSLYNGVITVDTFNLTACNTNTILNHKTDFTLASYSNSSYINGYLSRCISTPGTYDFPVGTAGNYELITIKNNNLAGTQKLLMRFVSSNTGCSTPNPDSVKINGTPLQSLLDGGYWEATPDVEPTSGTYDIKINERGYRSNPGTASQMTLVKRDNCASKWYLQGSHNNNNQSLAMSTAHAERNGFTRFSHYGIGWGDNALPVKLLRFAAVPASDNTVQITWEVAEQKDNAAFTVERSVDGTVFTEVGTQLGCGNCHNLLTYHLTDYKALPGISYYRLKQTDFGGHYTYSYIVMVNVQSDIHPALTIHPNPAHDMVTDSVYNNKYLAGNTINIYNALGIKINTVAVSPNSSAQNISISHLPAGTYVIEWIDGGGMVYTARFIKL